MKKLLAMLLALVMVLSFAACSTDDEPVDDQPSESEAENPVDENPVDEEPTEATYTLGMGVVVSTASSTDGQAQADSTVAVVVLDAEGKIADVEIDVAQTKLNTAEYPEDLTTVDVRSKAEKEYDYNMLAYGGAQAEWFEQVDALEEVLVGMTAADVEAIETVVNESGHAVATDETILAACTMNLTEFKEAIVKACNDEYAKEFTTGEGWTLGLGVNTSVADSKAATADANGTACFYTNFAGTVTDADGVVLAALCDMVQVKVGFDATGAMTNAEDYDANFRSKKELKYDYNMVTYGGAIAEWFEQALAFEEYVVGMTADEVASIETVVNEEGHHVTTDETLLASCTMSIDEFINTVGKALA